MKTLNLSSAGMNSTQAAVPHARVIKAIEEQSVQPAVTLNGVYYFDLEPVERIHEQVTQPRAAGRRERAAAVAASA